MTQVNDNNQTNSNFLINFLQDLGILGKFYLAFISININGSIPDDPPFLRPLSGPTIHTNSQFRVDHQLQCEGPLLVRSHQPEWSKVKLNQIVTSKAIDFKGLTLGFKTQFYEQFNINNNSLFFKLGVDNSVWIISSNPLSEHQLKTNLVVNISKDFNQNICSNWYLQFEPMSSPSTFYWKIKLNFQQNNATITVGNKNCNSNW